MAATLASYDALSTNAILATFKGWKVSRYTHVIPAADGGIVFNGRTGAIAEFSADGFSLIRELTGMLNDYNESRLVHLSPSMLEVFRHFQVGGFVVPDCACPLA